MNHPDKCLICLVHKVTGRLENWSRTGTKECYSIAGEIHDDRLKRWENGHFIYTSIVREEDEYGHCWTHNSLYILGEEAKVNGQEASDGATNK